ncbi:MAG: hypothetical protein J6P84_01755 [Alphaproteobacteria bacterium]|nr:hypothetical protein [Alphaproteobacteria bacterium]MBO7537220.1 hypothetical protein [Alphaproteobacteria bacterium]MBO7641606.1 hypothetical protein [Alphaproteobacteria bacterium]
MAKIKLRDLFLIIFALILICCYQNFKIRNYNEILAAEKIRKAKIDELQKNANLKKFLKPKEKMFGKNENLKQDIFEIFKKFSLTSVLFKEISAEKFELKFKINSEKDFYTLLDKLRTELGGIISFDEIKIKNLKKLLQVSLLCRIFYPPQNLQKYFYVNKTYTNNVDDEKYPELFDLPKITKYQLNGIMHYDIAYINGKPFHEGDSVGGYEILKIYDEFITAKNKKNLVKIKLDETW